MWESCGVVAAAATGLLRGPLRFRPLKRAGCAALHIPRPCAFHALEDPDDRSQCRQIPRSPRQISFQKRIDVASLGGRCLPCHLPCAEERASILTTGADDKRARSQCKGTRLRRSCPCGQTLALPACPHVSRFFVVRIHSRSKTHRRTHMKQINESSQTELQSATTERKSAGVGRQKAVTGRGAERAASIGSQRQKKQPPMESVR